MNQQEKEKVQLSFRLPRELDTALKERAKRIGVSQNAYILMLIDLGMRLTESTALDNLISDEDK